MLHTFFAESPPHEEYKGHAGMILVTCSILDEVLALTVEPLGVDNASYP
jgi:hypothetical protein